MTRVVTYSRPVSGGPVAPTGTRKAQPDDTYAERIVKFIPGEVLAFFVPASAAAVAGGAAAQLFILLVGLVGNVLYLRYAARRLPPGKQVLPHYFAISSWAFLIWAFATNAGLADVLPEALAFGVPNAVSLGLLLIATVFLAPAVDEELARL